MTDRYCRPRFTLLDQGNVDLQEPEYKELLHVGLPTDRQFTELEAVARLGSVTQAAKELHVTHSAISQQIKVLEEMLGVRLFTRHGRGVQINEEEVLN